MARPSKGPVKRPVKRPATRGAASRAAASGRQRSGPPGAGRTSSKPSNKPAATGRTGSFTTRAAILLSVVLLLFASYASSLHAWWSQRGEIESSKAEIAMRKEAITDIKSQQDRWNDDAFVKQQARERFGWVMPGEVGYRVIGADGKVQGDVPALAKPQGPEAKEWYEKLWGSVVEAGKEPQAKKPEKTAPDTVITKSDDDG